MGELSHDMIFVASSLIYRELSVRIVCENCNDVLWCKIIIFLPFSSRFIPILLELWGSSENLADQVPEKMSKENRTSGETHWVPTLSFAVSTSESDVNVAGIFKRNKGVEKSYQRNRQFRTKIQSMNWNVRFIDNNVII